MLRRRGLVVAGVSDPGYSSELPRDMHGLRDDLAGREVARVAHLAGRAKHAAHRAADLARHARRHAAREAHEDGLDALAVGEREQVFAREAVGGVGGERDGQRGEARLGGEARAHLGGQLRHGDERVREREVEVIPQPRRMDRREPPAREEQAQLLAGEVVEVDGGCGHAVADDEAQVASLVESAPVVGEECRESVRRTPHVGGEGIAEYDFAASVGRLQMGQDQADG